MKNKENEQTASDREVSSDNKEKESVRECEKNNLDVPIDVSEIIDSLPEDKKSVLVLMEEFIRTATPESFLKDCVKFDINSE